MHRPSRPPNRLDGSPTVTESHGTRGDPPQTSRSDNSDSTGGGEPDSPSRCRFKPVSPVDSLGVFQKRSIFHLPRRASSGYFSYDGDSLPSSPLSPRPLTADKATQTPSPSGQVMQHALQRMTEAHGGGPGTQQQYGHSPSLTSRRQRTAAGDMQAEAIGRDLRRFGDNYNRLLLRGMAGRHGRLEVHPNPQPHIQPEPTMLLCTGLLILLIGWIIYLQGNTNSHDHSQV
ncbi:bcl-2-like protein 11 [Labrus mixtus]|uniref:bcl-2-like protein 11 n=1 Tax=Labrus mixtus TaxID=508554 RepID=UPI0029C0CB22|nr:bcl-2-like protein 11 [Labrus mixtus]